MTVSQDEHPATSSGHVLLSIEAILFVFRVFTNNESGIFRASLVFRFALSIQVLYITMLHCVSY